MVNEISYNRSCAVSRVAGRWTAKTSRGSGLQFALKKAQAELFVGPLNNVFGVEAAFRRACH